jgi:MFS transporter, PHS family, inorganic phosphate transporter
MLAGTAGTWFLLDYAYCGNTISTPQILSLISPIASTMTKIALQLAIFAVAAVPGYLLAIARLDKIGRRRLQLTSRDATLPAASAFAWTPRPAQICVA